MEEEEKKKKYGVPPVLFLMNMEETTERGE